MVVSAGEYANTVNRCQRAGLDQEALVIDKGPPVRKHRSGMKNSRARAFFLVSLVAVIGAAATILSSGRVFAGDNLTIAVLGLEASEGAPDSVAAGVTDALRQQMSTISGYRLVQGRDLVEVKLVFSCPDEAPACMAEAAKSLGASRLIFGAVKKAGSDAYSVTLKLFDADKGVVESWTTDQFARAQSSGSALHAPAQKWVATLTGQSLPGTLHILGGVVGAAVAVDGVNAGVMGSGGLTIPNAAAGKHEITVTKSGYVPAKKSVTLGSGDSRDVAIEMAAEAPAPAEAPKAEAPGAEPAAAAETTEAVKVEMASSESGEGRLGYKVAAWLTLAGGVAGIAVGIRYSLLVIDANNLLDPYRRFNCTKTSSGAVSTTGLCDKNGKQADKVSDSTAAWMKKTKDNGDRYQVYQFIGYAAGGVLLATSAVFFYRGYLWHPSGATADARGSSFQLVPVFSPDGVGAMAFTTF
jgi:hypothetical protein